MAHRDVKPGNILFDGPLGAAEPWLRVKLCDFGFAIRCANKRLKKQVGTPQYVAPELTIPPDAHAGYRGRPVDMWALGCGKALLRPEPMTRPRRMPSDMIVPQTRLRSRTPAATWQ